MEAVKHCGTCRDYSPKINNAKLCRECLFDRMDTDRFSQWKPRKLMLAAPALIGLSGKMGTGKSSVTAHLLDSLQYARRSAFADLLKEEAAAKFRFSLEWAYSRKDALIPLDLIRMAEGMERAMTVREILQWYGTDVIRARDAQHWIKAMVSRVAALRKEGVRHIVIDDVRFPNEAECVKQLGGIVVRLEPFPGHEADPATCAHASETSLDDYQDFDLVLHPERGHAHIRVAAESILQTLTAQGGQLKPT